MDKCTKCGGELAYYDEQRYPECFVCKRCKTCYTIDGEEIKQKK